jgi:hypothetical protein
MWDSDGASKGRRMRKDPRARKETSRPYCGDDVTGLHTN